MTTTQTTTTVNTPVETPVTTSSTRGPGFLNTFGKVLLAIIGAAILVGGILWLAASSTDKKVDAVKESLDKKIATVTDPLSEKLKEVKDYGESTAGKVYQLREDLKAQGQRMDGLVNEATAAATKAANDAAEAVATRLEARMQETENFANAAATNAANAQRAAEAAQTACAEMKSEAEHARMEAKELAQQALQAANRATQIANECGVDSRAAKDAMQKAQYALVAGIKAKTEADAAAKRAAEERVQAITLSHSAAMASQSSMAWAQQAQTSKKELEAHMAQQPVVVVQPACYAAPTYDCRRFGRR
jgi:hypothetical protein